MGHAVSGLENVTLLFSARARQLKPVSKLTLGELLLANRFPPSLFQAYEVPGDGTLKSVPMSLALDEFPEGRKIVLQCIRNTDIDALRPGDVEVVEHGQDPVTAMYDFQWADEGKNPTHQVHLVDDAAMHDIVFGKVSRLPGSYERPGSAGCRHLRWGRQQYARAGCPPLRHLARTRCHEGHVLHARHAPDMAGVSR
jgi:hypothetical protein